MMFKSRKILLFTALLLMLTACGGSGDSSPVIDTDAPVITLKGDSSIDIMIGTTYEEQGATAFDDKDGTVEVTYSGTVDTDKIDQYTITYQAVDKAGNRAEKRREVNVVDTTPPTIELNGEETITLIKNELYTELGAEAKDNFDGILSVHISGEVDTTREDEYTVTYTAEDTAGNKTTKVRTVKVVLSEVGQLLEDAANETNMNVHYIVVGDSTRNYPYYEKNTILVDTYYTKQLGAIDVEFHNSAFSGQRIDYWLANEKDGDDRRFIFNEREEMLRDNCTNECSNVIVEFSLGINDNGRGAHLKSTIKDDLLRAITALKNDGRSKLKILLVSPVYNEYSTIPGLDLEKLYNEVADEEDLALVSGAKAMKYVYDYQRASFYMNNDDTHPNENGSLRLVNYIFSEIGGSALHNKMTISPANDSPTNMQDAEMHVDLDDIRLRRK